MNINRALLAASWRTWITSDMTRVGPYWLQLLWTLLFCAGLALVFTVFGFFAFGRGEGAWHNVPGWLHWYAKHLTVCLVIGYLIHGLFELGAWLMGAQRLRAMKGWRASVYFAGIPLLGVVIGWPLGVALAMGGWPQWLGSPEAVKIIGGSIFFSLVLSFGLHLYFLARARQSEAEKRATEAQLRLLQAQMEPHFLFNTLANVQSLINTEPAKAHRMLDSFTDYLRATLTQLRTQDSTLAEELALAEAYLVLLQFRMEDRLRFEIVADASARSARLPPLVLQPLVENAIHHGLEPKLDGGCVKLHARVEGGQLHIEVIDDGLGLTPAATNTSTPIPARRSRGGAGIALANLRERLAGRYGSCAVLALADNTPGTRATLTLPFESAAT